MDEVKKVFLFDHGIALKLKDQTNEKINTMVIELIENKHVSPPEKLKIWYQLNRKFNFTALYIELIYEVIQFLGSFELKMLSRTNKYYHQSIKNYKLAKELNINYSFDCLSLNKRLYNCQFLANRLIATLKYENYPNIFLISGPQNNFNLFDIKEYINLCYPIEYNFFNLTLELKYNRLHYIFIKDGKIVRKFFINYKSLFNLLFKYYYFYIKHIPFTTNMLRFDVTFLKNSQLLPHLNNERLKRLNFMVKYTKKNYIR
jgi:hypothetical protein